MALMEAAFSLASSSSYSLRSSLSVILSSSPFSSSLLVHKNALSIKSIIVLSKRNLSNGSGSHYPDIEDSPPNVHDSFLRRFRTKRGLSVTDLTSTEWCEKQMEFSLQLGGRKVNKVMRAGIARHAKLEQEVITRVEVKIKSREDGWALKFLNFINGVNQLLDEGLTRELPIMGIAEGIWMVGVIDEIRMPLTGNDHNPFLIDTKTRSRDKLPSEPQRRNGRLQLMCYKYLWDNLVADDFPSKKFFTFFGLNPQHNLCEYLKVMSANSGFSALTLDDVVRYYENTCKMLPPAHDQLLLRYEYQKDYSLLGEDKFAYDSDWLKNQIRHCLEFWHGEREASYASAKERWKCGFCQYATVCPLCTDDSKRTMTKISCKDSNIRDT
ncbi:putative exonuclease V [Lupinus albus]|uniref:Putative exonuclease V n=1 Tax=Lupinus albus TaxID=3870 RepID=A0A6A4R4A8_LUPAL|nr:putative exonuclease V [Lupinus albus]